jgi:hypothetical protein
VKKLLISACLCILISFISKAQSGFRPYAGAGYGMENRIGFRGLVLQAGGEIPFGQHFTGIIGADFFYSRQVPKWGKEENKDAYFRQFTPSLRIQYSTGQEAGTGFLIHAGMGIRTGKSYHFQSGEYHNGSYTNHRYTTEKFAGKGFMLGLGYGFHINEKLIGKIEFTNQAFLMLNDQYTLSFKLVF